MKIFISAIVFFVAMSIGNFGFCQIVGTVKYFKSYPAVSAWATIIIWTVILSAVGAAAYFWLPAYRLPFFIAYGVSFLLSFRTKQD